MVFYMPPNELWEWLGRMLPQIVMRYLITERDDDRAAPRLYKRFKCPGCNNRNQIRIRYNPPTAPKNPSIIAGQVPDGKLAGTPLPLNGAKEDVADAVPLPAPPVPPPVRFAPLGYRQELSQNKGELEGMRLTPIGRETS
jgi:hypothetical protein